MAYIFGYGSLIEQASRLRSTPSALYVLPARARGYARGWWARTGAIGFSTTFVGAIPEKSGYMNGVIYAVNKEELDSHRQARTGLYARRTSPTSVEILSGGSVPKGKVWIYLNDFQNDQAGEESAHAPVSYRAIVRRYLPDRLPAN